MRKIIIVTCVMLLQAVLLTAQGIGNFKAPKDFVFVPAGTVNLLGQEKVFQAFYMFRQEVTNGQYKLFLNDLKKANDTAGMKIARIQTERWADVGIADGEAYIDQLESPVVCISRAAAVLYCKWLTRKIMEENKDNTQIEIRLPMRDEWVYAAMGGRNNAEYPWEGYGLKGKDGAYLAQFKALGQVIGPVKVRSFPPNDFKLFDMSGNVAEMVGDMNLVMGGHWNSSGNEIKVSWEDPLAVSPLIGFRPVFTFIRQ